MNDDQAKGFSEAAERLLNIVKRGEVEWAGIVVKTKDGATLKVASAEAPKSVKLS